MQSRITGTTMPVLEFILEPNEAIISEAGELSWMGSSIQMTTHTQFGGGGGLFGVIKRVAGGGSIFMLTTMNTIRRNTLRILLPVILILALCLFAAPIFAAPPMSHDWALYDSEEKGL